MPRRCALGCPPNTRGLLHIFPNPDKYPEQHKAWVKIVTGGLDCDFDYQKYRVCDRHFTESDRTRSSRLNVLAVPSLFLSGAVMHRFPNHKKNPVQFKEWVTLCGGTLETEADYEYYKKKIVCAKHFTDRDRNRNNRLNVLAVPSHYLSGVPLHKFPNPDTNPEKLKMWISNIGGEIAVLDYITIYNNRRVCDNHFQDVHKYPKKRLSKLAVPIQHIPGAVLHAFPDPSTDSVKFHKWLNNAGLLGEDNEQVFKNRRICRLHFEQIYHYPKNRLSRLAVPTLHLSESTAEPQCSKKTVHNDHDYYSLKPCGEPVLQKQLEPTAAGPSPSETCTKLDAQPCGGLAQPHKQQDTIFPQDVEPSTSGDTASENDCDLVNEENPTDDCNMETTETSPEDSNKFDWIKEKLKTVWTSAKFCGLCLESQGNFYSIDMEIIINNQKYSKCLRDITNYVFNDDIMNLMSSFHLCDSCTEKIIQSYIFIHNSKQWSKILNHCVSDIYTKAIDIHEQLDCNMQYNISSIMIVADNETEFNNTIIDVKTMNEIMPTTRPIPMKETVINISKQDSINIIKNNQIPNEKPDGAENTTLEGSTSLDKFTENRSPKKQKKAEQETSAIRCHLCDKCFTSEKYLCEHYKTHSIAMCQLCKVILSEDALMDHLKTNHASLINPCKMCDLVFYTKEALDTHLKASHSDNDKNHNSQCIMCLKKFTELEVRLKHKCKFSCSECFTVPCIHHRYLVSFREQLLDRAKKVKCIDCDYVTSQKEYLIRHANKKHLNHRPFICSDCGNQFYNKLSLKRHISHFHQEQLFCIYCDFQFKDNSTLENHRKVCKFVKGAIACSQCVASFDTEEELTNHETLRHNKGVHACTLCKGRFLTEIELKEHRAKVHSGIQYKRMRKHIECSICNIMFNNRNALRQHEKLHDTIIFTLNA